MSRTIEVTQYCEECGTGFPIRRRMSKLKGKGHVKHMYCPTCKKVTAHTEEALPWYYYSGRIFAEEGDDA